MIPLILILQVATIAYLFHTRRHMSTNPTRDDIKAAFAAAGQEIKDHIAQATTRITGDISGLKQQIADLQAQQASGSNITAEDLADLATQADEIAASVDSIDPSTPAAVPTA